MSQAEFTVMRSMDLYYQYLNAGIQLPIGAGTDKMGDNIPVGSNRLYARFGDDPGYDRWVAGLKAGNGFVANGPMLTFEVDGHSSGDVVGFAGVRKVKARATAGSILPFQSLEIVANGETALIRNMGNSNSPGPDGVYSLELEGTIDLDQSTWLAARVADSPARRNRILPRELTVFAHSNPVYFRKDGKPVRILPSIQYLQRYVKGTIHWLNTGATFRDSVERAQAMRAADQARKLYANLAN
jgi:hypothetical protein